MEQRLQQDVVLSRFGALYLPALVQSYLHPPAPSKNPAWQKSIAIDDMPLANAYGFMVGQASGEKRRS